MKLGAALLALALTAAAPTPEPTPTPSPQRVLALIRATFRSHRPPPPYISYTIARKQLTDRGAFDYAESYTDQLWVRNLARAALKRRVFPYGGLGPPQFERPAFNEDRDPGPPTADIFEPATKKPTLVSDVPTHGEVGKSASGTEYVGDGKTVDYTFTNIKFPSDMPEWYFNARQYAGHQKDLPT